MTKMNDNKVWLITGASKGLGKNLVESVLERGDCVVATSRSRAGLTASLGLETDYFLPVVVNLSDPESIQSAVNQAQQKFGRIDVLVNNAGYGQFGAVEELTDAEVRGNFEVNVFGLLNMVRGVLPLMREKKSGHVLNISSIGGILGEYPGVGVYCATKFAVAGLTEGLYSDLKPLGIRVSVVYPGYFRTDFLSSESVAAPRQPIPDYVESKKVVDAHLNTINQNQPGDPKKAALAMIKLVSADNPPLHFVLGKDAVALAESKIAKLSQEMNDWKETITKTDIND